MNTYEERQEYIHPNGRPDRMIFVQEKEGSMQGRIDEYEAAIHFLGSRDLLWESNIRRWYTYNEGTGLWVPVGEQILRRDIAEELGAILPPELGHLRTAKKIGGIIDHLAGLCDMPGAFDFPSEHIHLSNYMLSISGEDIAVNPFSKQYYSRNRTEIAFDHTATCPVFLKDLLEPALEEDDIELIRRYAGQCLLGRNLAQRVLILTGTPGGGKSTLVNVLTKLIGEENVTQLRVPHLLNRFEVGQYAGHTLLAGLDVPGDFLNCKGANMLKSLVGGDRVKVESKGGNGTFGIPGVFNTVITSNNTLSVSLDGDRDAWGRRLLLVNYSAPPPTKPIQEFHTQLIQSEGSGILNWAIHGARQLIADLDAGRGFNLSDKQQRRVDDLLDHSDSLRIFVSERLERKEKADITTEELVAEYGEFCRDRGWTPFPERITQSSLADILRQQFSVVRATDIKRGRKNRRGYRHLCLKSA